MNRETNPIAALIFAGTCYGTSYAAVGFVSGTNPMVVTGARFALFGLLSVVLLGASGGRRGIPWRTALLHAAGGSVGLYLAEVTAIGLAGAGPTIAVVGSIPLVYAAVGARRDGTSLRPLLASLTLTLASHAVIYRAAVGAGDRPMAALVSGLGIAAVGVAGFCGYALHATEHLRRRPDISPQRWSSAVGVACGMFSVPLLAVGGLGGSMESPGRLAGVAVFLAVIPSWIANTFWNRGVVALPRSLAGQLLVFEPLSAFVFVHLVALELPTPTLLAGELLLLAGALLAIRGVGAPAPAPVGSPA
jgi:drug/metabolite transporter (DMT)-like permease